MSGTGVAVSTDGYLIFPSVSSYETMVTQIANYTDDDLDTWETTIGHTSSYQYYNVKDVVEDSKTPAITDVNCHNKTFVDPLFMRLISKDGIIQIGDYLFNSRIDDGYVLQMYADDLTEHYSDFKAGIFDETCMNKWDNNNLGEEGSIFDVLETRVIGMNILLGIRDLFGSRLSYREPDLPGGPPTGTPGGPGNFEFEIIGSYQNIVFYRSLIGKFKYYSRDLAHWRVPSNTTVNINHSTSYADITPNNRSNEIKSPTTSDVPVVTSYRHKVKWRAYESTRRLERGILELDFAYEDRNGGGVKSVHLSFDKDQ